MEKLQKALEKARGQRMRTGPTTSRILDNEQAPSASNPDVDARWAALEEINIDEKHLANNRIMTVTANQEGMPFDILRTKVLLMMRQNNWTRLAITSPEKDCGKSTLACNLAFGFNRQKGVRTMLLDFDLRAPSIGGLLGQLGDKRIEAFLSGEVPAHEHLRRYGDNLAISVSAMRVPDPMQLILSPQTLNVLSNVQTNYEPDLMIFDLPPMLSVDETRAILKHTDCAIVVARAEQTRMSMLDLCEREVAEHCNVMGVVLNNCRFSTDKNDYAQNYY